MSATVVLITHAVTPGTASPLRGAPNFQPRAAQTSAAPTSARHPLARLGQSLVQFLEGAGAPQCCAWRSVPQWRLHAGVLRRAVSPSMAPTRWRHYAAQPSVQSIPAAGCTLDDLVTYPCSRRARYTAATPPLMTSRHNLAFAYNHFCTTLVKFPEQADAKSPRPTTAHLGPTPRSS